MENQITWTANNSQSFLNGVRSARSVHAAIVAGRSYVRRELLGEGVVTVFKDGEPVRQDGCNLFSGFRWETNTDL